MRDFEARDLREKIPDSLAKELAKQEKMSKETEAKYGNSTMEEHVRAARIRRLRAGTREPIDSDTSS